MSKNDIHDLMLGAAVAVAGFMLWQHFKAKKQAQTDARLAASVPQEIRQWEDPNSPLYGLGAELSGQLKALLDEGLTMPITIAGQ